MTKNSVIYEKSYQDYKNKELSFNSGDIAFFYLEHNKDKKVGMLRISAGGGQADSVPQSEEQKKWVTDTIERLSIDAKEDWGVNWNIYGEDSMKKMVKAIEDLEAIKVNGGIDFD